MRLKVLIGLLLAGITLAIYWPASQFTFVYYDDPSFLQAPEVATGISPAGINWAMTSVVAYNWHPLTTFSFLLIHEFLGLDPGAEHLVNVFFHAANAVLLFLVMAQMTGGGVQSPESKVRSPESRSGFSEESRHLIEEGKSMRRSAETPLRNPGLSAGRGRILCCAMVAGIFAWHPLHVESVAWIAERKDVLFAFFMLLSLWCYALYALKVQSPESRSGFSEESRHFIEEGKSMRRSAETPLRNPGLSAGRGRTPQRGVPTSFLSGNGYYNLALVFFILSFLSKAMVVTLPFLLLLLDYWPLQRFNRSTTRSLDQSLVTSAPTMKLTLRSLIFEKWRFFALMIFFCILTFRFQKTTGAVVGLDYIGMTARLEDTVLNYTGYLGKFFWPANLAIPYPFPASFDIVQVWLAALLLLAISALCILQIRRRPYLAVGWFWYLGTMVPVIGLVQLGVQGMADRYAYITLIGPSISVVWLVWEWVRGSLFWKYLAVGAATVILAVCAILTEKQLQLWKDTVTLFSHSAAVTPENAIAQEVLAMGLENEGLLSQAAVHYRIANASRRYGDHFMSNFRMAALMAQMGYDKEAEAGFEEALKITHNFGHDSPVALNDLAWLLATSQDAKARNGPQAVQAAEQACELTHYQNPTYLTTLAAAYAEAGRFDDAVNMTQKAIALANQDGLDGLAEGDQELLETYSAHKTYAQTHGQGAVRSP